MDFDLATSVQNGWSSISHVKALYWFALAWFLVVYNLYHYNYWIDQVVGIGSSCAYMMACCPTEGEMETKYQTGEWEVPEDLERNTILKLKEEHGEEPFMVDKIEHMNNVGLIANTSKVDVTNAALEIQN